MTTLPRVRQIQGPHYSFNDVEDPDPYVEAISNGTLLYVHVRSDSHREDGSWGVEVNLSKYIDPVTNDVRFAVEFWDSGSKTITDFQTRTVAVDHYRKICATEGINKHIRIPRQY